MNDISFKWLLDLGLGWLAVIWISFFRTGSHWVDQTFTLPDPATTPPVGARGPHLPLGLPASPTPVPRAVVDLVVGRAGPDLQRPPPSPWTPATWAYIISSSLLLHCHCKNEFLSHKTTFWVSGPKTESEVLFFTEQISLILWKSVQYLPRYARSKIMHRNCSYL